MSNEIILNVFCIMIGFCDVDAVIDQGLCHFSPGCLWGQGQYRDSQEGDLWPGTDNGFFNSWMVLKLQGSHLQT